MIYKPQSSSPPRDEGVIKYECIWEKQNLSPDNEWSELINYRNYHFQKKEIGVYPDGIGYGNISIRCSTGHGFYVSGTQTGHISQFENSHIVWVYDLNHRQNKLYCKGPLQASSESMTHGVIYQALPEVKAIIHIHNLPKWRANLFHIATTGAEIPYGTPEMSQSVLDLISQSEKFLRDSQGVFCMAGHEEGIVAFAPTLKQASHCLDQLKQ